MLTHNILPRYDQAWLSLIFRSQPRFLLLFCMMEQKAGGGEEVGGPGNEARHCLALYLNGKLIG